jgi:helix-turn-helix protein
MYRLPDNFVPSEHGQQILQVSSESYSYEITSMDKNGDIKFVISVMSLNNNNDISYYIISSNEMNLYDIFSEFEDTSIKFNIIYCEEEGAMLNQIVSKPIKNFYEAFGIVTLNITHID